MTNPVTPIYGLPYEDEDSQPLSSLTGGSSNTEAILAEAVEDELDRIDTDVAAVASQANDLTSRGWHDITAAGGTVINSATVFPIDSGVFDLIRVYLRGSLTDSGLISLRANNEITADLHRRNRIVRRMDTGAIDESNASEGTQWFLARWGTAVHNVAYATIFNTDINSLLTFDGGGYRNASPTSSRHISESNGALTETRLLDSIQVLGSAGADIDTVRVWITGHRA